MNKVALIAAAHGFRELDPARARALAHREHASKTIHCRAWEKRDKLVFSSSSSWIVVSDDSIKLHGCVPPAMADELANAAKRTSAHIVPGAGPRGACLGVLGSPPPVYVHRQDVTCACETTSSRCALPPRRTFTQSLLIHTVT